MKYSELKTKTVVELNQLLQDSRDTLQTLRFKVAANQLKEIRQIRQLRQVIARILTARKIASDTVVKY